jgi:hypothetical protein
LERQEKEEGRKAEKKVEESAHRLIPEFIHADSQSNEIGIR